MLASLIVVMGPFPYKLSSFTSKEFVFIFNKAYYQPKREKGEARLFSI